ncbi:terminase small subunit [Thermomonospora echinospora]|uniref:terminase small subunit n=1 Tax=Thermomonospora echinospora TaxID=1992 RepID=UPI001F37A64D|nr:hypothetical protein [Thermomonospora echinospora]
MEPQTNDRETPNLCQAVLGALEAMTWLTESDSALIALALRYADEIEQATEQAAELERLTRDLAGDEGAYKRLKALEAKVDVTKRVGWLGPQLQGVLRDLGGTPAARKAMGADKPVGGRLAELRRGAGKGAGKYDS